MSDQEEKVALSREQILELKLAASELRGAREAIESVQRRLVMAERDSNEVFAKIQSELSAGGEFEVVIENGIMEADKNNMVRRRLTPFGVAKRAAQAKVAEGTVNPPTGDETAPS